MHRFRSNHRIFRNTWSINIKFVVHNCVNFPESYPYNKYSIAIGAIKLLMLKKSEKVNDTSNVVKNTAINHTGKKSHFDNFNHGASQLICEHNKTQFEFTHLKLN